MRLFWWVLVLKWTWASASSVTLTPPFRASCPKGKEKADHTTHAPDHSHPPTTQSTHTRKLTKRTRDESLPPPLALSPTEALLRHLLPFKFCPASLPSSTPGRHQHHRQVKYSVVAPMHMQHSLGRFGKAGAEPHGDQEGQDRTCGLTIIEEEHHAASLVRVRPCPHGQHPPQSTHDAPRLFESSSVHHHPLPHTTNTGRPGTYTLCPSSPSSSSPVVVAQLPSNSTLHPTPPTSHHG